MFVGDCFMPCCNCVVGIAGITTLFQMHSCFPSFFQASLVQNETEKITFQNPDFADQHLKAIANRLGSQSLY